MHAMRHEFRGSIGMTTRVAVRFMDRVTESLTGDRSESHRVANVIRRCARRYDVETTF